MPHFIVVVFFSYTFNLLLNQNSSALFYGFQSTVYDASTRSRRPMLYHKDNFSLCEDKECAFSWWLAGGTGGVQNAKNGGHRPPRSLSEYIQSGGLWYRSLVLMLTFWYEKSFLLFQNLGHIVNCHIIAQCAAKVSTNAYFSVAILT